MPCLAIIFAQSSPIGAGFAIRQKNMTDKNTGIPNETCPAEGLLKVLAGKWKPGIFRLASEGPVRFGVLLKQLPGCNRQSLTVALRELEAEGLLDREIIRAKPLHVEYRLSEKGQSLLPVFRSLEVFSRSVSDSSK